MTKVDYLIIGGGIAGTTAAESIRAKDPQSSITILTEESERLYSRVLLPHYLRGENALDSLYARTSEVYQEKNISLLTQVRATKVDLSNKLVTTQSGQIFSFNKLLIASGGKVTQLHIPGGALPEVVYLRTLQDAKKIKELLSKNEEGAVFGGGFIGIDLVQTFVINKLKTTAVIREKFFWETVVGENSGQLLSQILTEHGVTVLPETEVVEFVGSDHLERVKLNNGQEILADIVGVGIGIHLDLDYLKDSGLTIKKGVVTNEFLETSVKDVWAAGDVAEFYDPIIGAYHSLGNWANSSAQGRIVGANMAGDRQPFETTSMYSINIFESNFSFLGDPVVDENTEVLERGGVKEKKLARLLLRDDTVVGASLINLPLDRNIITQLIKNRTKIEARRDKLADFTLALRQLPC